MPKLHHDEVLQQRGLLNPQPARAPRTASRAADGVGAVNTEKHVASTAQEGALGEEHGSGSGSGSGSGGGGSSAGGSAAARALPGQAAPALRLPSAPTPPDGWLDDDDAGLGGGSAATQAPEEFSFAFGTDTASGNQVSFGAAAERRRTRNAAALTAVQGLLQALITMKAARVRELVLGRSGRPSGGQPGVRRTPRYTCETRPPGHTSNRLLFTERSPWTDYTRVIDNALEEVRERCEVQLNPGLNGRFERVFKCTFVRFQRILRDARAAVHAEGGGRVPWKCEKAWDERKGQKGPRPKPLALLVLSSLFYIATGGPFSVVEEAAQISEPVCLTFFDGFLKWFVSNYFGEFVKIPTTAEEIRAAVQLYEPLGLL